MQNLAKISSKQFLFSDNYLLLTKEQDYYDIPDCEIWPESLGQIQQNYMLGLYHGYQCYVSEITEAIDILENCLWLPLKLAIERIGFKWFHIIARAYQVINWDKNHRYCGRCGGATEKKLEILERYCVSCSLSFFPRISPSIIVLIRKGNQILLARKADFPPDIYGLVAGFVEPGESLEETLRREVREEVGISVQNIRYFGSQPWPFPDSLMMAFTADYAGGDIQLLDGELEWAGWCEINCLPGLPSSSLSIARQLINSVRTKA